MIVIWGAIKFIVNTIIVLLFIVGLPLLIIAVSIKAKEDANQWAIYESKRENRFFNECLKYEPKYMCDVKWETLK